MGINLTGQTIASTYQELVLISGSVLSDGTGSDITSLDLTASNAVSASSAVSASHALIADSSLAATSASYALSASHADDADTSISASHALNADSALTAATATSSSYALTASYAENAAGVDQALYTASISDATVTFTKGDASTFDITVNNVVNADSASVAVSSSYALTASFAENSDPFPYTGNAVISGSLNISSSITNSNVLTNQTDTFAPDKIHEVVSITQTEYNGITPNDNTLYYIVDAPSPIISSGSFMITGSVVGNTLTFTKGDGSTFNLTVQATASAADSLVTASISDATITFTKGDTSTFNIVVNNVQNAVSASYALTASYLEGGIPTAEALWASYTGSNNAFLNTASFNYTIAQGYATSSQIENSVFAAVNSQIGSARNSAIIGGTGQEMYDNTGGFGGVIVENSVILGGTSNGIFGDANGAFILGGNNNQVEADDTNNSGIIGGNNNVAYAVDNTVVIGGSSNLLRSTSDNTVAVGSTSNTLDFTSKTTLINSHNNSNGTSNTNVTLISTDGATAFQDYNVYIGVNGAGRTFDAGTATTVKTYIDDLTISGSFISSGSVRGEVGALSISSNTASLDCSTGNFFTLQLVPSVDTHINPTNIQPGQTINLKIATTGSGTVSFPSSVLQSSGSAYVPTTTTGTDIVTFISYDSTNLYLSNIKNFI
jgi:peroxiredoxin